MTVPISSFTVKVDPTNPGQFFACCGLLEMADQLWPGAGAEGWFEEREFCVTCDGGSLEKILEAAQGATIAGMEGSLDEDDEGDSNDDEDGKATIAPVELVSPIVFRMDWWSDKSIKTWAGSMNVHRIALAMARAINTKRPDPFAQCEVVYDPSLSDAPGSKKKPKLKKREPFYFDTLRGPNAHARDVGFSANDLKLTTAASPAVEFFCLVGLQRCRPKPTQHPRVLDYYTWTIPLPLPVIPAAVSGLLPFAVGSGYRFKNSFRSGQKKLKAYMPAIPLTPQENVQ